MFLSIDTEHFKHTGIFTLTNRKTGSSFTFPNADLVRRFTYAYYRNPIAATFAYETQNRKTQSQ